MVDMLTGLKSCSPLGRVALRVPPGAAFPPSLAHKTAILLPFFSNLPGIPGGYNTRMDFFFPEDDLNRLVPEETRITSLTAEPYPDGERVRVNIEMTPFQKRPHLEVTITGAGGEEVATASIVEPMGWKLEFTMHLRGSQDSPFKIEARLYYPDGPQPAPVIATFDAKAAGEQ
jgi:hypothetical protein